MHLIPSYKPLSKSKPTYINRRIYSDENCDNLKACFDTTEWDNLITDDDDIDTKTDVITDYVKFCTDLCIPVKTVKKYANQKPWMTRELLDLIDEKQQAHVDGNKKLYHKLIKKLTRGIKNLAPSTPTKSKSTWRMIRQMLGMTLKNSLDYHQKTQIHLSTIASAQMI